MIQKKEKKGKKISMIAIQDHAIIGRLENEFLRIEPYGPNAIRVRASMGKISDENWTLLPPEASDCEIVTQEDGSLRMKNGRIELVITADSRCGNSCTADQHSGIPFFDCRNNSYCI